MVFLIELEEEDRSEGMRGNVVKTILLPSSLSSLVLR
jgi:hypothetical protein